VERGGKDLGDSVVLSDRREGSGRKNSKKGKLEESRPSSNKPRKKTERELAPFPARRGKRPAAKGKKDTRGYGKKIE